MPPAKRKASKSADGQTDSKQVKQEDQKAVRKKLNIPVDEGFSESTGVKVHIDSDGTILDASLNRTDVGQNNNKFYRLQLLEKGKEFWCHTRWGRLGEFGQKKTMGPTDYDSALNDFQKKFREKTGLKWEDRTAAAKPKKYFFLERNYEDDSDNDDSGGKDEAQDSKKVKKEENEEADAEDDAEEEPEPESKLEPRLKQLIELIFNENNLNMALQAMGYNAEKLPLGKLSENTILKGFECLQALEGVLDDPDSAQKEHGMDKHEAIEHFTNRYYSFIPHVGANKRARLPLINDMERVKTEVDMLDDLSTMGITNKIMQDSLKSKVKEMKKERLARVDEQFRSLRLDEATALERGSQEYKTLEKYLINMVGATHNLSYKIHEMFRIDRNGERSRYEKAYGNYAKSRKFLLWHGSRVSNYGGILSQGLRIAPPEAPASGYMFGKGIYLADISTKSANYCLSGAPGSKMQSLIMVCEVELGDKSLELLDSDIRAGKRCKEDNLLSTQGMGNNIPGGWVDAGAIHDSLKGIQMPDPDKPILNDAGPKHAFLQYNEYIVYDVAQVRIRYLIQFENA